jgi:PASTA domain/TIR domain
VHRIFINYRREDTLVYADILEEVLSEQFGPDEVFRDVDTIEMGLDFVDAIDRALSQADVMLVLIGRHWVVSSDGRRRLHEPEDYVRLEVAGGLERPNVRVIPILVGGAKMPAQEDLPSDLASLTRRNAFEMTDSRLRVDRDELVRRLSRVLEPDRRERESEARGEPATSTQAPPRLPWAEEASESPRPAASPPPPAPPQASHGAGVEPGRSFPLPTSRRRRWIAVAAVAAVLVAAGIVVGALSLRGGGDDAVTPSPPDERAVAVPDVVGSSQAEAEAALEQKGFEVSTTLVVDEGESGLVVTQDPAPGTDADEGTIVTLEVSQLPIDALLTMVPRRLRSTCEEVASADLLDLSTAGVTCSASSGAIAVSYNLFPNEGDLHRMFGTFLELAEDQVGHRIPRGNCETDQFARHPYTVGGTTRGRVLCYRAEGGSWIHWTDSELLVYSLATRSDLLDAQLYRWWRGWSGPVAPAT